MFCSKCGTKALDGAEFCQKCGARLIADAPAKQSATPQANPVQQLNPIPKNTSKKKKSKLPVILGIGALMVVLLIVLASIGGKEEPSPNSSEPVSAADPSGEDRLSPNDISSPASSGFGSLCFKGVSVEQLLGASQSDMIDFLGEPDSTDLDEDKSTYGDAAIYFDVWSLSEPYLTSISSPSLSDFTYNGRALSVDLREIIGREPDDDGLYYDTYWMEYQWDHKGSTATLTVRTPATDESLAEIEVSVSWQDTSESSNTPADNFAGSSSYTSIDPALVGRWRSYDGGSVEFSEYGEAAVSFSPHGSLLIPNNMTWEAYDGRIILSSHFSETSTWQLSEYYNSTQLLSLSTNTVDTYYTRSESSTSLVGTWDKIGSGYKSEGAIVLYSDGTGTMDKITSSATFTSEHVPISWRSDDTNLYISWTLQSAYDYTVSGDTLTIFFSNGSQIYTKVSS